MKKLTTKQFIQAARLVHGNKYTYKKTVYVNTATKTIITCKAHGDFLQRPNTHLQGSGCYECGLEVIGQTSRLSPEDKRLREQQIADKKHSRFLNTQSRINIKHPNIEILSIQDKIYHLSCTDCGNRWTRIKGTFSCLTCKHLKHSSWRIKSYDDFLNQLHELHGNKFEIIDGYKTASSVKLRCTKCGTVKSGNNGKWRFGCAVCFFDTRSSSFGYKRKSIEINGVLFEGLQGYEPIALKYMQSKGVDLNKLRIYACEEKPTFRYKLGRTVRTYIPDFFLPSNLVIEVKSIYTLGLTGDSDAKQRFKQNVLKAKACLHQGYKFKLLVFKVNGSLIKLPKDWYNYSRSELRNIVGVK